MCKKNKIMFNILSSFICSYNVEQIKHTIVVKETKMSAVRRHSIQGYMMTATKRKTNRE